MDKTRPPRGEPLAVTHPPPSSIPEKFNKELNQTADAYHEAGHCVAFAAFGRRRPGPPRTRRNNRAARPRPVEVKLNAS